VEVATSRIRLEHWCLGLTLLEPTVQGAAEEILQLIYNQTTSGGNVFVAGGMFTFALEVTLDGKELLLQISQLQPETMFITSFKSLENPAFIFPQTTMQRCQIHVYI